jgi:hypothetical protein
MGWRRVDAGDALLERAVLAANQHHRFVEREAADVAELLVGVLLVLLPRDELGRVLLGSGGRVVNVEDLFVPSSRRARLNRLRGSGTLKVFV